MIGLAIARQLAPRASVILIDREPSIGSGISSRNSEVIHAGLYYPQGSLKARLCVEGKYLLYEYCGKHAVDFQQIGKLVVASQSTEQALLDDLAVRAKDNGVDDLTLWSKATLRKAEPSLAAESALFSPSTGIIDSHGFMQSLRYQAEMCGAQIALNCHLQRVEHTSNGFVVSMLSAGDPCQIHTATLINCAGLEAQQLAQLCGTAAEYIPTRHLCKGSYFNFTGKNPFSHLIYPLPPKNTTGLGIHATLDLGNQLRFGPDVEYLDTDSLSDSDYAVELERAAHFYPAIRRYFPGLPDNSLQPAYAGIRPKLHSAQEPSADFMISTSDSHQQRGLIHLFGIESPGLTASLAIARHIEHILC